MSTPLPPNVQLSAADCPTSEDEIRDKQTCSYRELVGALAWLALGTRLDDIDTRCLCHQDDRRSAGAYLVKTRDGIVSWESKKQSCVALSSTEEEYMVLCQASKESVWMADFLESLGVSVQGPVVIIADNQGSIARGPSCWIWTWIRLVVREVVLLM